MSTLTKSLLSEQLYKTLGVNRQEAMEMVECFFETIVQSLDAAQAVKLSGFGNFVLLDKKCRPGRNPKTGASVPVSARRVVTFHAGQKLKEKLRNYVGPEDQDG